MKKLHRFTARQRCGCNRSPTPGGTDDVRFIHPPEERLAQDYAVNLETAAATNRREQRKRRLMDLAGLSQGFEDHSLSEYGSLLAAVPTRWPLIDHVHPNHAGYEILGNLVHEQIAQMME